MHSNYTRATSTAQERWFWRSSAREWFARAADGARYKKALPPHSVHRPLVSPPFTSLVASASPGRFGFLRSPRAPLRRLLCRDLVSRETSRPRHLRHRRGGGPRARRGGVAPPEASSGYEFSQRVEPAGAGSGASPAAFHRRGSSCPPEAAASPSHRGEGRGSLGGVRGGFP